ncbi:MAG: PIG-L family deacetylase [Syntrophobacteraceae bacterium]|jgi:LmbE family N-acetylglucosaminyl deacetylase|nr:PIG-L family deacetylase [Syntrophobacteraceae bacterium]
MAVDVMVVCPHADDAEFGAAGTVARWTREGRRVVYVVITNGDKGTTDRSLPPESLVAIREREQRAAAHVLGVEDVVFLGYPDQGLEDTPAFRKDIVRQIRIHRPEIVVTSDPYRRYLWHRDHRVAGQVVMDAVYPFARDHLAYPDLMAEGLEPHKVREVLFWAAEDVNYHVDITETFFVKLAALRCHESQVRELAIPDLESWLRQRCMAMAEGEAFELAEGFHRVEIFW